MRFKLLEGKIPLVTLLPARLVALTCLMLVAMVMALTWTRESGNNGALENEKTRISAALDTTMHRLVLTAIDHAVKFHPSRLTFSGADHSPATTPDGRFEFIDLGVDAAAPPSAMAALLADQIKAAREALALTLRGSIPPEFHSSGTRVHPAESTTGFLKSGSTILAWAMVPAQYELAGGQRRSFALVLFKPVDMDFLGRLSDQANASSIKLDLDPVTAADSSAFTYASRTSPVYVSWKPDRPGDRYGNHLNSLLITFMALYTGLIAFHMTRKLADSEVEKARLATQDMLTGLANRLLFTVQVDEEIAVSQRRTRERFALFYLNFDRFKEINDTFGHDGGDLLILSAARRIESLLRPDDKLARFGGDEFGIIQCDINHQHDCKQLAKRLMQALREPFDIDGQKVFTGVSIGIAIYDSDIKDRAELMRRADLALYRAKNHGRDQYIFFDHALNSELQRQKKLEDELRDAIKHNKLDVYYQPIVSAGTHKLSGVEALARWNHPDHGMIEPHEFIAIAEERSLIADLGRWVLKRACQDAMQWSGLKLAVNVSAIQFRNKNFLSEIKKTLEETGFDPHLLELEITESVVIDDAEQAEKIMIELREMGVRLALDDFGTGYSSLIYLRRFAIDKIKIDRSFVQMMERSLESMEIVRNVVELGQRLGLTVTAEGVENLEQIELLEKFGCQELQGYYFGKPLTHQNIPDAMAAGVIRAQSKKAEAA